MTVNRLELLQLHKALAGGRVPIGTTVQRSNFASSLTPLHKIWMPMHTRMKAESRTTTWVPLGPKCPPALGEPVAKINRDDHRQRPGQGTGRLHRDVPRPRLGRWLPKLMATESEPGPTVSGRVRG